MSEIQVGQINSTDGSTAITTGADGYVSFAKTQIGGRRNFLINSDFQVSQRGDYTSATALPTSSTYYLDRFKFRRNGVTGTFTHKLNQTLGNNDVVNTVRLDVTSTATGRVEILQLIEEVDWFKNKTITFSAQVKSNSTDARLVLNADGGDGTTASSAHTGGGEWELLTGTATLTSGVTRVSIYAGIQAATTGDVTGVTSGDYIEVSEIQVEVGTVASPFEHISYGEQLALCQRYYYRINSDASGNVTVGQGGWNTSTEAVVFIPSPVPMRTAPTFSATSVYLLEQNTASRSVTGWSNYSGSSTNGRSMVITTSAGGASKADTTLLWVRSDVASSFVALDAEL